MTKNYNTIDNYKKLLEIMSIIGMKIPLPRTITNKIIIIDDIDRCKCWESICNRLDIRWFIFTEDFITMVNKKRSDIIYDMRWENVVRIYPPNYSIWEILDNLKDPLDYIYNLIK